MNNPSTNMDLTIRQLCTEDAAMVSSMLQAQSPEYARFFYAFNFSEENLRTVFSERKKDVYSGMFWRGELAGVFMLRGWDAGYEVPSFGVFVAEKYKGGAFMRLSLDVAKLIVRLSGGKRLMAKIHPDNISLRGAIRLGFAQTGTESETGNLIYHMDL
jgi:hypothetical protein